LSVHHRGSPSFLRRPLFFSVTLTLAARLGCSPCSVGCAHTPVFLTVFSASSFFSPPLSLKLHLLSFLDSSSASLFKEAYSLFPHTCSRDFRFLSGSPLLYLFILGPSIMDTDLSWFGSLLECYSIPFSDTCCAFFLPTC